MRPLYGVSKWNQSLKTYFMPTIKSYATTRGHAYFKNTGSYNEVTTEAISGVNNHAPKAIKQKRLSRKGRNSAAAKTIKNVVQELGL